MTVPPRSSRTALFPLLAPLRAFLKLEAAGGLLLIGATVLALAWANSPWRGSYEAVLHTEFTLGVGRFVTHFSVGHAINDGLMAIFFFVVGMEIKRELRLGLLRTWRSAMLPGIAALGGVALPAAIYVAFTAGTGATRGWAIPIATDIAFCVGVLTLLKRHVSYALIVFITALAIFDDIIGIAVIAVFYGSGITWPWLIAAAALTLGLVRAPGTLEGNAGVVALAGVALWLCFHYSGVHATLAGVVLGLAIPAHAPKPPNDVLRELAVTARKLSRDKNAAVDKGSALVALEHRLEELEPPLDRFMHALHPWVAFGVLPLFALANAGVTVVGIRAEDLFAKVTLATALGLFVGKQLGIFSFVMLAKRAGLAELPGGSSKLKLYGVATLAGIGFTVSLFIANLAFADDANLLNQAKLGILAGSIASGLAGTALLVLPSRAAR